MSTSETKTITAEVSAELLDHIEQHAARCERSVDSIFNEALQHWLQEEEEKDTLTREAMAEADAGLAVDHADVCKWVESWDSEYVLPMPKPR